MAPDPIPQPHIPHLDQYIVEPSIAIWPSKYNNGALITMRFTMNVNCASIQEAAALAKRFKHGARIQPMPDPMTGELIGMEEKANG